MNSILPVYLGLIFGFLILLVRHAKSRSAIGVTEARGVYLLMALLAIWVLALTWMGMLGLHSELMTTIPLLWQALVPVAIWFTALLLSPSIRRGLHGIALSTPSHWLAWVQALRVGAIGGVMKGISGEIDSGYVLWIGIPDMLFGISALLIGWLLLRGNLDQRMLMFWNLLGFGLIFFPTFLIMPYWMSEPGFNFIFEYPMILAPGMVVATLLSLNLMQAWAAWNERNRERMTGAHPAT